MNMTGDDVIKRFSCATNPEFPFPPMTLIG